MDDPPLMDYRLLSINIDDIHVAKTNNHSTTNHTQKEKRNEKKMSLAKVT